jgi:pSer/pThr/pTyr-binding forkhead associated (FHA) protein
MLCRQCQSENPPQNAFCHSCGTPLGGAGGARRGAAPAAAAAPAGNRCALCGTENAKNMQFCRTCGSELGARAAEQPPSAAAPPATSGAPAAQAVAARQLAPTAPAPAFPSALCKRCGGQGDPNARFCKFCGAPFEGGGQGRAAPAAAQGGAPNLAVAASQPLRAQVVVIQRDGSEGGVYSLDASQIDVGSREGDIVLPDDPYLSARHARIERRGDTFVLRDLASANGVYMRLREPVELDSGDMFLIGQQVLRFEVLPEAERRVGPAKQQGVMVFGTPDLPRLARVSQYTTEGLERDVYYLYRDDTVFGREQADVVYAEDPFLSRRHAAITMNREQLRFSLRDLGSSNGTSLRCRGERALQHGDQFRLGRHLFRFDLTAGGRGGRSLG